MPLFHLLYAETSFPLNFQPQDAASSDAEAAEIAEKQKVTLQASS